MNNDGQLIVQEQTIVPDLLCFYSRDWMKKEILLRGKLINFHKQGGGGGNFKWPFIYWAACPIYNGTIQSLSFI